MSDGTTFGTVEAALDELIEKAVSKQAAREPVQSDRTAAPVQADPSLQGLIRQFEAMFTPSEVKESVNRLARADRLKLLPAIAADGSGGSIGLRPPTEEERSRAAGKIRPGGRPMTPELSPFSS